MNRHGHKEQGVFVLFFGTHKFYILHLLCVQSHLPILCRDTRQVPTSATTTDSIVTESAKQCPGAIPVSTVFTGGPSRAFFGTRALLTGRRKDDASSFVVSYLPRPPVEVREKNHPRPYAGLPPSKYIHPGVFCHGLNGSGGPRCRKFVICKALFQPGR